MLIARHGFRSLYATVTAMRPEEAKHPPRVFVPVDENPRRIRQSVI